MADYLESRLVVDALALAVERRLPGEGLLAHSDRGSQYASAHSQRLLAQHGITCSMSRRGNPYDNAQAESFMKTLKYEEVYRTEYSDFADARRQVQRFIESVYNHKRLHSALEYCSPVEFENKIRGQAELSGSSA